MHGNAVHGRLFSEGLAQFTSMSKICLRGGDEEVCPSLSDVPVVELCNQQCSGLFLAMLVSVRLSVVRKGPRSALACLSVSSCGGGEEACPSFDGQEGFENKVRACSRRA